MSCWTSDNCSLVVLGSAFRFATCWTAFSMRVERPLNQRRSELLRRERGRPGGFVSLSESEVAASAAVSSLFMSWSQQPSANDGLADGFAPMISNLGYCGLVP